jgi:hypothetical protein
MATGGDQGSGLPPAGWYPDAANPARERLWTGERWIEWIRPVKPTRVEGDPAGWRPDPRNPGLERLWSGEMWTEETRRVGEPATGSAAASPTVPVGISAAGAPAPPALRPARTTTRPAVLHHDDRPPERLRTLGILTQAALAAVILAALVELVANGVYIGALGGALHHQALPVSHTESVVDAVRTTRTIVLIAEAVTAIAFLFWFYRAYRNLIRTGIRDVRYGPGWAVGGWFIPFFNLVRPKQVANDIWKGSASAGTIGTARWREIPVSGLVNWWWGVWIFGWVMAGLGSHSVSRARVDLFSYTTASLRDQRTGIWFLEFGLVALVAAAVLAIVLVRSVSRLQDDNFKAVPAWSPEEPAPFPPPATAPTAAVPTSADSKTCPDCAEEIKAAARVCRYCGYRFDQPPG